MGLFYLDEDIPPEVGKILAQRSHDVVHVFDLGIRSTIDPEHLRVAARDERILVTFNRNDFRELHQLWVALNAWGTLDQPHAGILTSWGQIPATQWADLVHAFVGNHESPRNQIWEWRRQQQIWERFGW